MHVERMESSSSNTTTSLKNNQKNLRVGDDDDNHSKGEGYDNAQNGDVVMEDADNSISNSNINNKNSHHHGNASSEPSVSGSKHSLNGGGALGEENASKRKKLPLSSSSPVHEHTTKKEEKINQSAENGITASGATATVSGDRKSSIAKEKNSTSNNSIARGVAANGKKAPSSTVNAAGAASLPSTTGAAVASTTAAASSSSSSPPPPVMRGTLSYEEEARRHLIRGMWNYENSDAFPPQQFELTRTLLPGEDPKILPQDGEFHGFFSLFYVHTTSKGKQKERSKKIPESGVKIKFEKIEGTDGHYVVDGRGTNQFGVFNINGTAEPSKAVGDPTLHVVLRKRYEPAAPVAAATAAAALSSTTAVSTEATTASAKKLVVGSTAPNSAEADGPLPEPSQSFPQGVVCLRGQLYKEEANDGLTDIVHRVHGVWASGLDLILADPQNVRGLCNRFEYEHKSSVPNKDLFPISGRYSGWFDLSNEDGTRTRINERDVILKFKKNSSGYHNIEGKGSNVFGKYNITGSLTLDNVITIFRHFQPRKLKTKTPTPVPTGSVAVAIVADAPAPASTGPVRRPSALPTVEHKLKLEHVQVPGGDGNADPLEPIKPPAHATYSAVSRGVLRLNEDGSHGCQGKWAVTREHFTNNQTSGFNLRLEAHFVVEALEALKNSKEESRQVPLDSAFYKGSFQLRKQGTRYQTIVDTQVVMKFRKNTSGSYNVYGKGTNAIGDFDLLGTMVMTSKTGGHVELYRMYPIPAAPAAPESAEVAPEFPSVVSAPIEAAAIPARIAPVPAATIPIPAPTSSLQRRESTRLVKLPSRLEDDDPTAQLSRTLDKCSQILKIIREKDVELGAFFNEPVDPVALGIPTYHQVIKEPMDLKTVQRKLDSGEITNPEEFARFVRLVFENAMTFNVDPAHSVHQSARTLLVLFNQKFRDVERVIQNIRRSGVDLDDKNKKKGKDDKKRKRQQDEAKSMKRRRLEEAQAMASANAAAVAAIVAAAPSSTSTTVSRSEFTLLLQLVRQLQEQIVQTHTAVADLSPGDENDASGLAPASSVATPSAPSPSAKAPTPAPAAEKKKAPRKKPDTPVPAPAPIEPPAPAPAPPDDSLPLSLEEQELLTETINDLPPEHLGAVIQIIREAAPVGADEEEIDLEIDQLDTKTQRKLLRHVSKFVKKPKGKQRKTPKPSATTQQSGKSDSKSTTASSTVKKNKPAPAAATKKPKQAAKAKPATDSFFPAFVGKGDGSDSDSDLEDGEEIEKPTGSVGSTGEKEATSKAGATDGFNLRGDLDDDEEDDSDDDDLDGGITANWNNISSAVTTAADSSKKTGEGDDAWGAARELAAVTKQRELEKKAREEKMKAEAELAKSQRLADAAARGEELRAQRLAEEAEEARLAEEKEKEAEKARQAARDAARAQVQSVEQTVDLDAQRVLMQQYEQNFLDKDLGSASPSSDFGF